jgi:transcriptional regulator with XRE-family HTH domain
MAESFGARLRLHREEQNVALVTIAEQTKIKASLLEGLERDDVSRWPSGIFRRAYIRAYAQAIGLSPDDVLREFVERHPDPAEEVEPLTVIAGVGDASPNTGGPPTRIRYMVGSAMASLSRFRRSPAAAGPVNAPHVRSQAPETREQTVSDQPVDEATRVVREREPVEEWPATNEAVVEAPQVAAPTVLETLERLAVSDEAANTSEVDQGEPPPAAPDLWALANLCTELGRVENADQMPPLLQESARLLDAPGLIVWVWDEIAGELRPALVHGYSDKVVAQLPPVGQDADNVTAAAFRSGEVCTMAGSDHANGALVVPLLTPAGCAGVLALELPRGRENTDSVRAVATVLAALLAQLIGDGSRADVRQRDTTPVSTAGNGTRRVLRVNMRSDGRTRMRVRSSTAETIRANASDRRRALYSEG